MEGSIGEVRLFAGTYIPKNWERCKGQEVEIDKYKQLFKIIGTKYGGDGVNTFQIPQIDPAVGADTPTPYDDLHYIICIEGEVAPRG